MERINTSASSKLLRCAQTKAYLVAPSETFAINAVYGSIEAIPDDPQRWTVPALRGRERLAAALAAHRADVGLYKVLATLRRDVPLRENLNDLDWAGVPRGRYEALCTRLGFRDLINRPTRWA